MTHEDLEAVSLMSIEEKLELEKLKKQKAIDTCIKYAEKMKNLTDQIVMTKGLIKEERREHRSDEEILYNFIGDILEDRSFEEWKAFYKKNWIFEYLIEEEWYRELPCSELNKYQKKARDFRIWKGEEE